MTPLYPNIQAIADGRIAGPFREWPALRPEARALLARLAAVEAELEKIRAADKLAPMLDFIEIADFRTRQVDRLQGILNSVAAALKPAYGDDVHRCTQETLPEWVSAQVAELARMKDQVTHDPATCRVCRGRR